MMLEANVAKHAKTNGDSSVFFVLENKETRPLCWYSKPEPGYSYRSVSLTENVRRSRPFIKQKVFSKLDVESGLWRMALLSMTNEIQSQLTWHAALVHSKAISPKTCMSCVRTTDGGKILYCLIETYQLFFLEDTLVLCMTPEENEKETTFVFGLSKEAGVKHEL